MPRTLTMHRFRTTKRTTQQGAGLVEVLVALVVIGVGMLGIASLYVITLQAKTASQSRMQAVYLAADMAERIRTNATAGASYAITSSTATPTASAVCFQTATTAASSCTPAQIATADLAQWSAAVTNTLPGSPTRSITYVAPVVVSLTPKVITPAKYNVTLTWTDTTAGTLNYSLDFGI